MGIWRLTERSLRPYLAPGERIRDGDRGRLPDGTAADVFVSARAVYVVRASEERIRRVRRVSFAAIASVEIGNGSELSVAVRDTEPVRVGFFWRATPRVGTIPDFVRRRLLEMPAYERKVTADGGTWRISFHPWRPGAAASWVEHVPAGVQHPVRSKLYDAAVADVEALAAGQPADPSAIITGLPEVPDITGLRYAWAHYLGALDPANVLSARSVHAESPSQITFLAAQADTVWVIDADQSGQRHPRLRPVAAGTVCHIGDLGANKFCLLIGDPDENDTYIAEGDETGLEWLRRLAAAAEAKELADTVKLCTAWLREAPLLAQLPDPISSSLEEEQRIEPTGAVRKFVEVLDLTAAADLIAESLHAYRAGPTLLRPGTHSPARPPDTYQDVMQEVWYDKDIEWTGSIYRLNDREVALHWHTYQARRL